MLQCALAILNAVAQSPLAKLLAGIVVPVVGFAVVLIYRRYAIIIKRGGPHERRAYTALRQTLAQGGLPARIYAERLKVTLDAVDRFFGDAGMADRTLWPRAFGLRTPASLWTAPSFDRCLLLALIYPIATVFVIWAVSGHVGPAEHALLLSPNVPWWSRATAISLELGAVYAVWRCRRTDRRPARAWLAIAGAGAVGVAAGLAVAIACADAGGAGAVAVAVAVAVAFAPLAVAVAVAIAVYVAVIVAVGYINDRAAEDRWQGSFQAALTVVLTTACVALAGTRGQSESWRVGGPLVLFLGLLTLLNVPFDWASLGLTRALLRRGLELRGWWPYLLAIVDALAAAGVIALLTMVCVLGVQAFDDLAVFSGGDSARILPLTDLFNGIEAHPSAPEFWWVYVMLLSTMIPSFVNLMIGGASLVRGIPWMTKLLLHLMPERGMVSSYNRQWIATLLTAQVFVGAAIGIAAQVFLAYVVIGWVLPLFGVDLLELARAVAAPDVPGRVITAVLGASRG